jgi:hypothetical protein
LLEAEGSEWPETGKPQFVEIAGVLALPKSEMPYRIIGIGE